MMLIMTTLVSAKTDLVSAPQVLFRRNVLLLYTYLLGIANFYFNEIGDKT